LIDATITIVHPVTPKQGAFIFIRQAQSQVGTNIMRIAYKILTPATLYAIKI
jgi:hypothetical protein